MKIVAVILFLILAQGGGCGNAIVGVQDYGSLTGRVLDATNNRPISGALVSVGSLYTATTDTQGAFTIPHVPIGLQSVTARSPGYDTATSDDATVVKDQTASVGYVRLGRVPRPGATPMHTMAPPPTPTPVPEPTVSAFPSTAP
jgi:carboxypeptidase family protein